MAKRRTKNKKKKTKVLYQKRATVLRKFVTCIIIIFCAVSLGIGILAIKSRLSRPLPETPAHNQSRIPREVKKAFPKIASASAALKIPILMYHYIEFVQDRRDTIRQSLDILPPVFDDQIKTLQDAGYTFITPHDLSDIMDGKMETPAKPIILSFDDGYRDFYTDAFPILKKYHAKGVAYVVPGFLDTPNYLFTWQLDEIDRNGLVEIGAHTVHHASLKGMNLDRATQEVINSKTMLEHELQHPITAFAYPYGSFDLQAITIVKNAGFATAVSTIPGIEEDANNRFFIYRIRPGGRQGQQLLTYLTQTYFKPW